MARMAADELYAHLLPSRGKSRHMGDMMPNGGLTSSQEVTRYGIAHAQFSTCKSGVPNGLTPAAKWSYAVTAVT